MSIAASLFDNTQGLLRTPADSNSTHCGCPEVSSNRGRVSQSVGYRRDWHPGGSAGGLPQTRGADMRSELAGLGASGCGGSASGQTDYLQSREREQQA